MVQPGQSLLVNPLSVGTSVVKKSYGQKTGPGHCLEQELVALRQLMINQAWEVLC
jgi:hypothetical protein